MTLAQECAKRFYQRPRAVVQSNRLTLPRVESVGIDHGYDQQTGSCVCSFRGPMPSWLDYRQVVQVWLGYGAFLRICFTGFVVDLNRTYGPDRYELRCSGVLWATLQQGPDDREWSNVLDTDLMGGLLSRSGVYYDPGQIAGDALVLAARKAVSLTEKQASSELIQRLDQAQGYATFDLPDGNVRRQLTLTLPSSTGALRFVEGLNDPTSSPPSHYILSIGNPATVRGLHTKVVVTGLPFDDGTIPRAAFSGTSAYAPVEQVYETSADLLETDDACATLAARLLGDQNRVITQVSMRCAGNPYLLPGMTVTITAPSVGIAANTPFFVVHVRHALSAGEGFVSDVTLYGGASGQGYRTELRPIAAFTYQITSEWIEVDAEGAEYLTVVCDASASSDPDTPFENLTFTWTSSGEPPDGTGVRYSFRAAPTALLEGIEVTLTVSDGTSEDVLTQVIAGEVTRRARELYVAAGACFLATPNGGSTWYRWPTEGSYGLTVRAVAPLNPTAEAYFGAGNGLRRTSDYCLTEPVLLHGFGSPVRAVWVHEAVSNRVLVGLENGEVHLTNNLDLGDEATWVELPYTFPDPVVALAESFDVFGQIRVAAGTNIYISHDQLKTASVLVSFAGAARAIALSFAGNYFGGAGAPYVQGEAGDAFSFPSVSPAVAAAPGVTTHIRTQGVYAGDDQGRTYYAEGGTAFTQGGTLGAGDPVNQLLRDGDYQDILYAAAADGVYKSYDAARTWFLMRPLTGAGESGEQLGYGGAALPAVEEIVVETTTADKAIQGLVPGGWGEVGFDDAGYPNAVAQTQTPGTFGYADYGAPEPPYVRAGGATQNGLRKVFALPLGAITGATIEVRVFNQLVSFTINGHRTDFGGEDWGGLDSTAQRLYTGAIPAAWLLPGADNVIALVFANGSAVYTGTPEGLPPGNDYKLGGYYKLTVNG